MFSKERLLRPFSLRLSSAANALLCWVSVMVVKPLFAVVLAMTGNFCFDHCPPLSVSMQITNLGFLIFISLFLCYGITLGVIDAIRGPNRGLGIFALLLNGLWLSMLIFMFS